MIVNGSFLAPHDAERHHSPVRICSPWPLAPLGGGAASRRSEETARPRASIRRGGLEEKVRSGSDSDLTAPMSDFRFTLQSRLKSDIAGCPKSAKLGSRRSYSIN